MRREQRHPRVSLAIVFKDFAAWLRASCVGLNVAGYTTAEVLREHGIDVVVFPVRHNVDIVDMIKAHNETHEQPLTHVNISAPWLSKYDLQTLIEAHPEIKFTVLSHSNVGFLQADPDGMDLFRHYRILSLTHSNLRIGGNSMRFVEWLRDAYGYGEEILYLPNLYPIGRPRPKIWPGWFPLRIGAFGAVRPEKNFMTAAAAALVIQRALDVPVELHMSAGGEMQYGSVAKSIDAMCKDTEVKVIRHPWNYWDKFIELIKSMDLMLQPSFTESFNMITADAISVGVPVVVSSAISWAPRAWLADSDDAVDVARVGLTLLRGENGEVGAEALRCYNQAGVAHWLTYLRSERKHRQRRTREGLINWFRRFS